MVRLKTTKTQSSITSVGHKLKKAREEKNVSLEEAHKATKIHPKVLEALEEDRLESTLGIAYVKAFLKNYAHYLGLDAKKITQEYYSKVASEVDRKPLFEPKPFLLTKNRRIRHTIIAALVVFIWLFILTVTASQFIRSYKSFIEKKKVSRNVILEDTAKEIKSRLIPIPKSRIISLAVTAKKDTWLKVRQDNKVAFHGILSENSTESWQAEKEIMLSEIGRPEALSLNVNGKNIDFSGRRVGKDILITPEGINLEPGRKN